MKSVFLFSFCSIFAFVAYASDKLPKQIHIPTDSKAQYTILSVEKRTNGYVYISSKRVGSSGISYAMRKVDCRKMTFAYVSEGEALEDLKMEKDDGNLGVLVDGSISDYISRYACNYVKLGKPK